jgi:ribosomal protein L37AE/L43A
MNTNHYSDLYEEEFNYKCTGCGSSELISNTKHYGWVCDCCASEFEQQERRMEEYEARKRKRIQERSEY